MIRVKVVSRFKDSETGLFHDPGEVLTVTPARAERLVAIGGVEVLPEPAVEEKPKRKRGRPRKTKALRPNEDK